jgi:hypothetical protein
MSRSTPASSAAEMNAPQRVQRFPVTGIEAPRVPPGPSQAGDADVRAARPEVVRDPTLPWLAVPETTSSAQAAGRRSDQPEPVVEYVDGRLLGRGGGAGLVVDHGNQVLHLGSSPVARGALARGRRGTSRSNAGGSWPYGWKAGLLVVLYVMCFSRSHTAGARPAGRPGSLCLSSRLAIRPGPAPCPGRSRGTGACPGRRPPGR